MKKIIASAALAATLFSLGNMAQAAVADCQTGIPHTTLTVGGAPITLAAGNPAGWARGYSNQTTGKNANLLWVSKSIWGNVVLQNGKKYRFTFKANTKGWHPGATIWWRDGAGNTAPLTTVAAPFYTQDDYVGPVDCNGDGSEVVAQWKAKAGYDVDGMVNPVPDPAYAAANLVARTDGVAGTLSLTFTANRDGNFEFAASGFNPDTVNAATQQGTMTVSVAEVP